MAAPEADNVLSRVVVPEAIEIPDMVLMLQSVAAKRGKVGKVAETWVEEVRAKFEDVGVVTIRDFVCYALVLQTRLNLAGHRMLHHSTHNMMLREVSDMFFGPEEP